VSREREDVRTISSRDVAAVDLPTARPLAELVGSLPGHRVRGDASAVVTGLSYRSQDAAPGDLFFCIRGSRFDGHDFAQEAVRRGASAVVAERWLPEGDPGRAVHVVVPSVREAMGPISAAFFGWPADRMRVVGITGTNGKTTTTYLLESVFRVAGWMPGLIGTTGVRIDGEPTPFPRTTPEAPDLHRLLSDMAGRGVAAVAMEVSSHGLHQHRVDGMRFACSVFTNLSQDHLDYHASMEEYFEAKARLFTPELSDRAAVNLDAPEGRRLLRPDLPALTFGLESGADVRATDVRTTRAGLFFRVGAVEVRSSLRGLFNVENCLAALAAARSLGIEDQLAAQGISAVGGVPGRVETVEVGQRFLVMVDYAHTPDGVANVLRAARPLASGRLIVVLGCGGDRDRAKRPLMGKVASTLADLTVITSDNPRSEDPLAIIGEIEPGAREGNGSYVVEPDRRAAIRLAVSEASPTDVVVIAGKGHETGQEFADRTMPFDDRVVAAEEIRAAGRRV
jgi:UDP-N-acetylmuramoyl-L-alanyl-D-glutamate--2,6-diaminopimelate ligase